MLPSTDDPSAKPNAVRVGVSSPDHDLLRALGEEFEVQEISLRAALAAPEQLRLDVLLVDARHRTQIVPTARLVTEGTFSVVVMARPQDSVEAMKYLDVGALDVIWSGAAESEIRARIRSAARYAAGMESDWLTVGDLAISTKRHEIRRSGQTIRLTPTEFRLVEALLNAQGETVTHRNITLQVWGTADDSTRHQLRVYIRQLREKIEEDPGNPTVIVTDAGVGYRLTGLGGGRRRRVAS